MLNLIDLRVCIDKLSWEQVFEYHEKPGSPRCVHTQVVSLRLCFRVESKHAKDDRVLSRLREHTVPIVLSSVVAWAPKQIIAIQVREFNEKLKLQ